MEHPQGLCASQKRQRITQDEQDTQMGGGLLEAQAQEASSQKIGCKRQPNCLTEEQENEIAENIYDWWISGVSYKKWYAQKFLQLKFNFDEDGETN